MSVDVLVLACTDRMNHDSVELGRLQWLPASSESDGHAAWTPGEADGEAQVVIENARPLRRTGARSRHRVRSRVEEFTRPDGGRTFRLPRCPVCGRDVSLRDDTLERVRASWESERLDVSLLGM